jgi:hypothetical protein
VISFSNFHRLDPAARDVAVELLGKAAGEPPSFIAFMFRWMAFNGWMSAVTLEDTDAAMINSLVAAPRLIAAYDQLMAGDLVFQQMVNDFAAMWPVLNVRDVRKKLGYDAFRQYDRADLLAACAGANVKQRPSDWVPGTAPNWEQLLRTIYQVRCNLFHGEKSPQSLRDRDLVFMSDQILKSLIGSTGCFDWYDL